MTIGDWQREAREALTRSGCPDPGVDASWLLEDTLNMTRAELRFSATEELSPEQHSALDERLQRRCAGEPVQYILRRADFMGLKLCVDDRVLIPRPETETLAESAVARLLQIGAPKVLDLCSGSGAIGLSIKSLVPGATVTLSDASNGAVEIARINAQSLGLDVEIICGDLFAPLEGRTFDLIASNPPYIPTNELPSLQREVRWEPSMALNGGADGLNFYRAIAAEAGAHLNGGGFVFLEVGIRQAQEVLALLQSGLDTADGGIIKDIYGVERVVWVRR